MGIGCTTDLFRFPSFHTQIRYGNHSLLEIVHILYILVKLLPSYGVYVCLWYTRYCVCFTANFIIVQGKQEATIYSHTHKIVDYERLSNRLFFRLFMRSFFSSQFYISKRGKAII